ncbi:MAG: hypothetical protein AAGH70_02480 [Pseudomonadota bacterium]
MRVFLTGVAFLALVACSPEVPDSGAGVGFGTPEEFRAAQAARDAQLETSITEDQTAEAVNLLIPGQEGTEQTEAAAEDTAGAVTAGQARDTSGISDEQSFDAVSARETIESDAARIAANREEMQVIQPTALPTRSNSGPNIVQYALSTTNSVGQQVHRRSGLTSQNRFLRNCSAYPSADVAQQEFLASGGPERDRLGVDPDGDGFACAWDPAPFRRAAG